jgi:alanyl-tRNA synthetase
MKASEIRKRFTQFFVDRGHEEVKSSSLIPAQDPTILFANAGMNQFKDVFLGREKRSYTKAVSVQKCVRAGGKHNDLDNVGFTKRHLTFFEMLGNFSFGDYFKKEAILYAWDFLTKDLALETENLHATVHHTDDEAYELWHTMIGLPRNKIHRLGDADNFWQMGDVGPCGPCTEIHLDRGPAYGCSDLRDCGPACDCDRFLEIWNLVFMQYDRSPDGTLKELAQKGVDTGMGLERLCAIMQNKDSVFNTDQFMAIIEKTQELSGVTYAHAPAETKAAFHVLADHIRASSMLIADGCAPSNDGRGYVLRKIIRRAALFAQRLSSETIFAPLSEVVIQTLGTVYPELVTHKKLIRSVLESEVERFAHNLQRGSIILNNLFRDAKRRIVSGADAFKLYDTYGFPIELITAMARERAFTVDMQTFEHLMQQQKSQSGKKELDTLDTLELDPKITTEFTGYNELKTTAPIVSLIYNGEPVKMVPRGEKCFVLMAKSPFFIVGGGQVPDQGRLVINGTETPILQARYINDRIAVEVQSSEELKVGQELTAIVDAALRTNAMKNHTATHLLQAALMSIFGNQIKQSGSLVHPDYLRFDFTYHAPLSQADIELVEQTVNAVICENIPVTIEYTTLKEATKRGVIAFFGDKYNPEQVRVVQVSDISAELCGGTHVNRTGDIGCFKIVEVSALAAGHRRIVAVTGPKAIAYYQQLSAACKTLSQELSVKVEEIVPQVLKQKEELKTATKKIAALQKKLWHLQIPELRTQIQMRGQVPTLAVMLPELNAEDLREVAQTLLSYKAGVYWIGTQTESGINFVVRIAPEYVDTINSKNLASWLKDNYNYRSGGRPGELQGGGAKFDPQFIQDFYQWITVHASQ